MKKFTLLSLSIFGFFAVGKSQLVVDATDFANNPSRYNGKTIVIRGVTARKITSNSGTAVVQSATQPVAAPGTNGTTIHNTPTRPIVSAGTPASGVPTPTPTPAPLRCSAPKNWTSLDLDFPIDYEGCFIIYNRMANTLPNGQDFRIDITFKVDSRTMHRVTRVKLLP